MKYNPESWTVEKLIEMSAAGNLKVNHEYQRGRAWSAPQQKQFIDSILRGYPVPIIFLHDKGEKAFDIIDGQQRINALRDYFEKGYKLLSHKQAERRFPSLVYGKHEDSNWVGKGFNDLPDAHQDKIKNKKMPVSILQGDDDETRDLFIRLQEGSVLNDQERRDAWPGNFTEFIFEVGGRGDWPEPHRFFNQVMHIAKPREPKGDRGRVRRIATQLYQLHSSYANNRQIKGIGRTELNRLYMDNVNLDMQGNATKQFKECLITLSTIFDTAAKTNRGRLRNHGAFHLMLLATSLLENFSRGECVKISRNLKDAHKDFNDKCATANSKRNQDKEKDEYWIKYLSFTSQDADSPHTIKRRHKFFLEKMAEKMSNSEYQYHGHMEPSGGSGVLQRVCEMLDREVRNLRDDLDDANDDQDG